MYQALNECILSRALHWVSIPMPTHTYGFWVGMGVMLLFMGGYGWASVLCIPTFNSKSESNFSDAGNTLTKTRSGLKPTTMNNLLFVRSNQDLVWACNTHYTNFEYMGAIWITWVGIGRCWWLWYGYGYKCEGKCWALILRVTSHTSQEPRKRTLWEPKRKCSKVLPTHLQNHAVWSRTLWCNVKPYVTGPSTKCFSTNFYSCRSSHMIK